MYIKYFLPNLLIEKHLQKFQLRIAMQCIKVIIKPPGEDLRVVSAYCKCGPKRRDIKSLIDYKFLPQPSVY